MYAFGQKRTCAAHKSMSAKCQKRTIRSSCCGGDKKLWRYGKVSSLGKATLQHGEHRSIRALSSFVAFSGIVGNGFDHSEQTSLRIGFGQYL